MSTPANRSPAGAGSQKGIPQDNGLQDYDAGLPLASVYQPLPLTAMIKQQAEDFIVREQMAVEFSGSGEHCWLHIEKRLCNTEYLAGRLAAFCGVKKPAVAWAGLKDRHGITSQWFSVHLPGRADPDWAAFEQQFNENDTGESIRLLQAVRHSRKLQRGALRGNRFELICRPSSTFSDEDFALLLQRARQIAQQGVANYFGPQRFGREGSNLLQAEKHFLKPRHRSRRRLSRHKRGLYLSAARSWLFNQILSERVRQGVWDKALPGDVFMLAGRSACFRDDGSSDIAARLEAQAIHPTAPLWGEGDAMVSDQALALESCVIERYPVYRDGLLAARVQAARRSCRLLLPDLEASVVSLDDETRALQLGFSLPPGSYATVVLAEFFSQLQEAPALKKSAETC